MLAHIYAIMCFPTIYDLKKIKRGPRLIKKRTTSDIKLLVNHTQDKSETNKKYQFLSVFLIFGLGLLEIYQHICGSDNRTENTVQSKPTICLRTGSRKVA